MIKGASYLKKYWGNVSGGNLKRVNDISARMKAQIPNDIADLVNSGASDETVGAYLSRAAHMVGRSDKAVDLATQMRNNARINTAVIGGSAALTGTGAYMVQKRRKERYGVMPEETPKLPDYAVKH